MISITASYVPVDHNTMVKFVNAFMAKVKVKDSAAECNVEHDPITQGYVVQVRNGNGKIELYSVFDNGNGATWLAVYPL